MNPFTRFWNEFNKIILPSPLHNISSRKIILISFLGRNTGKEFTTPVNFVQQENILTITSIKNRKWWRNLITQPDVIITMKGKRLHGVATVFEEQIDVARELEIYFKLEPFMARFFKVSRLPDGSLDQKELRASAENRVVIKVKLADPVKE